MNMPGKEVVATPVRDGVDIIRHLALRHLALVASDLVPVLDASDCLLAGGPSGLCTTRRTTP